ncbi:SMP-30/gluconolactonase/LRE family protein [Aquimarina muelleri]|uniref:Gluconolactonase n=1 Tax=Aquimarina muelleri TaxID=279356 RepID=A0A918JX59_9FLAO|nr:SMP-30/gluconolactonase/LRE family protein [Aquimarina muelleri]MCX2763494.1 SMP-30/gluconolactonase/LRE family protein [Aquimarina muelleri]GGX25441.1 gluconolactonase [Aquimarina muelleri]
MRCTVFFLSFIILILLASCKKEIKSKDFTSPNTFTSGIEGPATDSEGNIYAVNYQKEGTVGKITPEGELSLFLELPNGSIGNGIRFGKQGEMYIADYTNHNILMVDMDARKISVFAHHPDANQPNDIAISPSGIIYASDPNWKKNTGNIWKITKSKGFEKLESDMGTTNGIEVSPDGKKLYVNESVQQKIWVYDIQDSGTITNKKLLYSFKDFGLDGMRCDDKGNLYVCRFGKGTIVVLSPKGKLLKEIKLQGKKPTNITFSNDFSAFYVTMSDRGCIEIVENKL